MVTALLSEIGSCMSEFSVAGLPVVVMGAARSGVAAALLLAERGARVTISDRRLEPGSPADVDRLRAAGIALELGGHVTETLTRAALVVLSPGVPPDQPTLVAARRAGVPVVGELELASRWLRGRIVAITGTKGKSTTATLAGRMLEAGGVKALVGGNIGVPLSAQVNTSTPDTIHVVEVSSFQLEAIDTFHPWIAVLLNVSADHLDRHASVEEYARAKARIFARQEARDWAVINADDPAALALARAGRGRRLLFSGHAVIDEGVVVLPDSIAYRSRGHDESMIPRIAVKLIGRHLVTDVAAAAAVARLSGVSGDAMTNAVASFTGLEHALERVAEVQGVQFVNDSKATNVAATHQAIESFGSGLVVILGGRYKGGDFRELREALASRGASVVAVGETRSMVHEALGDTVPVHDALSMPEAVRRAFACAPRGGTVLLAPACSSFDMYVDYAERGRAFKREVVRLTGEVSREQ